MEPEMHGSRTRTGMVVGGQDVDFALTDEVYNNRMMIGETTVAQVNLFTLGDKL